MKRFNFLLGVLTLAGSFAATAQVERHLGMVLDNSGSMDSKDKPRYVVHVTKIVADLLNPDDALVVSWMGGSNQRLEMRGENSSRLKPALDTAMQFNSGTDFLAPVVTVQNVLAASTAKERLMILISDAGSDGSHAQTQRILNQMRSNGVRIAAISVGTRAGLPHRGAYDTSLTAMNAKEMLKAVGTIYQQFLGAAAPVSGSLSSGSDSIRVALAPFVREAYLLVVADGPVGSIQGDPANPGARGEDLNHRSDSTRGKDGTTRTYRIARLIRPHAGDWTFQVGGLGPGAAWYLIQDFSVDMHHQPPKTVGQGADTLLTLELIDDTNGQRIRTPGRIPGLKIQTTIDGKMFDFNDKGANGDTIAGDGLWAAKVQFTKIGPATYPLKLDSRHIKKEQQHKTTVVAATWGLDVRTAPRTHVGSTVIVAAEVKPLGPTAFLQPPTRIKAQFSNGRTVLLHDDGQNGDAKASDRIYSRNWTPRKTGAVQIDYHPEGGSEAPDGKAPVEVLGTIAFGKPLPIELGRLTSDSEGNGTLDLDFVKASGTFPLTLSSDYDRGSSVLEIDLGGGFVEIDDDLLDYEFAPTSPGTLAVRLRVNGCPEGVLPDQAGKLTIETTDHRGQTLRTEAVIRVEVVEDTWLQCWWPVIAAIIAALFTAFILYGIIAPARFSRRLGIVLSPEEDLSEGYPFHVRSQKGSGSGFYRDARLYISSGYQLVASPKGALARVRADKAGVFIQPLPGNTVLFLNADNEWEALKAEETRTRFSVTYRNSSETLYFEFRNM